MKFYIFILFQITAMLWCKADPAGMEQPEKVLRITYEVQSNEWYEKQAKIWKKEIVKNPQNPEAWVNYYNANRYSHFENINSHEKKLLLNKIIVELENAIPGTFESYVLRARNECNIWDISDLEKAYKLRPSSPETYDSFITHYEVTGNLAKVKEFYIRWYESHDLAPWLLNYNYNVLMSVLPNAILFTNGDNDTYPARMLQEAKGVREDVTIINIPLSYEEKYLSRKLQQKHISIDIQALKDKAVTVNSGGKKSFNINVYTQELCKEISHSSNDVPLYFALTVYEDHFKEIKENLYIVGLAYRYSENRFDNLAVLGKNLKKNFRLDYLTYDWYYENYAGEHLGAIIQMNYIAPMMMLAKHYHQSGDLTGAQAWKEFSLEIAKKANDKKAVADIQKEDL